VTTQSESKLGGNVVPLHDAADAAAIARFWESARGHLPVECASCGNNFPGRISGEWRAYIAKDTGEVDHVRCPMCVKSTVGPTRYNERRPRPV
jgi:hypothetical protein